jgi:hypothetical protein
LILGTNTSAKKHKVDKVEQDISDGTQQKLSDDFSSSERTRALYKKYIFYKYLVRLVGNCNPSVNTVFQNDF